MNLSNSKLNFKSSFPENGIEFRYINKISKKTATIYGRLINQYKFRDQTFFQQYLLKK